MNGQLVKKGDLIAKVYDFKTVTAQILVSEKEIAGVRVGQQVALRARAYPSETFRGTVTAIATSARGSSDNEQAATTSSGATEAKTIIVTTQIDNQSLLLKPEMTGQAKIFCGPRRILDLITKNAAQTLKIDFWSWW
jgi:multidrug resistance efflux pump